MKKEHLAIEKFQQAAAEEANLMTSRMGRSGGGNGEGDQGERHCPGDRGMAVRTPVVSDTGPLLSTCVTGWEQVASFGPVLGTSMRTVLPQPLNHRHQEELRSFLLQIQLLALVSSWII